MAKACLSEYGPVRMVVIIPATYLHSSHQKSINGTRVRMHQTLVQSECTSNICKALGGSPTYMLTASAGLN